MPSQASIRSQPSVPLHGGLAGQVLGGGELAPVPGHDALGVAQRGGGDRLAAPAELGARLADGGGRRGLVTGDGGHARQVGQGGGNLHDDPDAAPAVGGPAQRANSGSDIVPGGGEAGLGQRAGEFHQPDGAASSRGPAQTDLRFGRVELAQGGEQLRPQPAHDRLGEAVRMRRCHGRGLIQRGYGGGLDARTGDRGDRPGGQREDEPFLARRRPGKLDRAPAVTVLPGQVASQEGRVGQQDLGPRRERRIGLAGQGPAGFDFGDDPVRVARGPGQAGQQVAAPDLQLRFASLPGTGDAVGGERGRPPVVPEVVRRPGGAEQHPGLDTGIRRGRDAGRRGQELARFAVPADGDPPPGQPGGQFPSRLRLGAAERPGQRGADAGLLGGKPTGPARPLGPRQGHIRRPGHLQRPLEQPGIRTAVSSPEAASRPAANWRTVSSSE